MSRLWYFTHKDCRLIPPHADLPLLPLTSMNRSIGQPLRPVQKQSMLVCLFLLIWIQIKARPEGPRINIANLMKTSSSPAFSHTYRSFSAFNMLTPLERVDCFFCDDQINTRKGAPQQIQNGNKRADRAVRTLRGTAKHGSAKCEKNGKAINNPVGEWSGRRLRSRIWCGSCYPKNPFSVSHTAAPANLSARSLFVR